MCATCGCSDSSSPHITDMQTGEKLPVVPDHDHEHHHHDHEHQHGHGHSHVHEHNHSHSHTHHAPGTILHLEQEILAKNNQLAERNRGWFAGRKILGLNLVSSPGAGKTTLLERTIRDLAGEIPIHVIEGDQETVQDAQRIRETGCKAVQINTGTGCHLDALMVARGLEQLDPPMNSIVVIENVGNLVCPALFDLGERAKVVVASVTEGEDKPLKYPHMFRASQVMLLNKIDLLPYLSFDVERCLAHARQVNPNLAIFPISATKGQGLEEWYGWIRNQWQKRNPTR